MKILVAPDKFKGTLSAQEVCEAIAAGWHRIHPHDTITSIPMADGGEGTCDLLTRYFHGSQVEVEVSGPRFEKMISRYGRSGDGQSAFIEMARASGLQLLKPEERNPLYTTTLGTGELIRHALDHGAKKIILGIGGSATNDAGMGMLQALGIQFLNEENQSVTPVGGNLVHIRSVKMDQLHPRLQEAEVVALCDVDNPFSGPQGAAFVYAPQKGADEQAVQRLDDGMKNFSAVVKKQLHHSLDFPGAGAGGGLPGGASAFLNLRVQRGMDFMAQVTGLEEKIKEADLIFTGEGKIDSQTPKGKVVAEVGRLAMKYQKRVIAMAGQCELSPMELQKFGIAKVLSLADHFSPDDSIQKGAWALQNLIASKLSKE